MKVLSGSRRAASLAAAFVLSAGLLAQPLLAQDGEAEDPPPCPAGFARDSQGTCRPIPLTRSEVERERRDLDTQRRAFRNGVLHPLVRDGGRAMIRAYRPRLRTARSATHRAAHLMDHDFRALKNQGNKYYDGPVTDPSGASTTISEQIRTLKLFFTEVSPVPESEPHEEATDDPSEEEADGQDPAPGTQDEEPPPEGGLIPRMTFMLRQMRRAHFGRLSNCTDNNPGNNGGGCGNAASPQWGLESVNRLQSVVGGHALTRWQIQKVRAETVLHAQHIRSQLEALLAANSSASLRQKVQASLDLLDLRTAPPADPDAPSGQGESESAARQRIRHEKNYLALLDIALSRLDKAPFELIESETVKALKDAQALGGTRSALDHLDGLRIQGRIVGGDSLTTPLQKAKEALNLLGAALLNLHSTEAPPSGDPPLTLGDYLGLQLVEALRQALTLRGQFRVLDDALRQLKNQAPARNDEAGTGN